MHQRPVETGKGVIVEGLPRDLERHRMSVAPRAFMRSIFAAGAVSITTTEHGTPACRAAQATPWPALPALMVHTPRRRSASDSMATALAAPRSL